MKRLALFALLCEVCLLVAVVPCLAKKKSAKPIIETFEARTLGGEVLRFEIEEFSTDQDIQELAKAYAKGGKDDVEHALQKVEKGQYFVRQGSYSIRLVQSASQGGTRNVFIIADAADRVVGDLGGSTSFGHRWYPFAVTQLRIDQNKGKGVGQQVPFAAITFSKQGIIDVKSMAVGSGANSSILLLDAHALTQ